MHSWAGRPPERLVYNDRMAEGLNLWVVKPEGWRPTDRRMAMVWIHGGGWTSGSAEWFLPHCRYFARAGAVAFSVEYRLAVGGNTLVDCIADCQSAVKYIRQHAQRLGVDPEQIVVGGDSAGGYLAACLGIMPNVDSPTEAADRSSRANAMIVCGGIFDLTTKWRDAVPDRPLAGEEPDGAMDTDAARTARARRLSPIFRLTPGIGHALVLHGGQDQVASPKDAERFCEVSTQLGNPVELKIFPGLGHAFILFNYTAAARDVLRALADILRFVQGLGYLNASITLNRR